MSREEVLNMMAGGKELDELSAELEEFSPRSSTARPNRCGGIDGAADLLPKERRRLIATLRG